MAAAPFVAGQSWHILCPALAQWRNGAHRAAKNTYLRRPRALRLRRTPPLARCAQHAATAEPSLRFTSPGRSAFEAQKRKTGYKQRLASASATDLEHMEPPHIYHRLRRFAAEGNADAVDRTISHLLTRKGEPLNVALYSAAILSNISPEKGSAARAASLLREMGEEGLEPTAEICHDMLKVLAVHPDYLLRDAVAEYMRQRWFSLTVDGRHDFVIGLLREGQFEMALGRMDAMLSDGILIQGWLYDMVVYMLCEAEEVDEALRIMQQRVGTGELGISKSVWFSLLDTASSVYNHAAIEFVWKRQVQHGYLNPSSGICFNVLAVAARTGDVDMATEVFSFLGERKDVFTQQHYEMLVDAYIQVGDTKSALSVLCIMQSSGTRPDEYSTRGLIQWARARDGRVVQLFEQMRSLKDENETVPVAAVNALIEATIHRGELETAVDVYKALHMVCTSGPTTTTFNLLFRGCQKRKDLAMFLAAEMVERHVEPDTLTYDRLLLVCLNQQDYDDAFRYYEEMRTRGWIPRTGTFNAMVRRCARAQDTRAWDVVTEMAERGVEPRNVKFVKDWLEANWGKISQEDAELTR